MLSVSQSHTAAGGKTTFLLFLVEQYLKNVTTEMIYISTNMIGSMCTCICVCAHMHTEMRAIESMPVRISSLYLLAVFPPVI